MTHLDVILNIVVQQPTQGCDLIRPDVKAHHSRNLLPVTLMQASVADGSDEGQQLLEAGDFGLALLCSLGGGFHHRLCSKGLHIHTQMQSEHPQVLLRRAASMLAVCSLTLIPSLLPKSDQDRTYNDAVVQHVTMCKEPQ